MKKRLLSILMALCLLITSLPFAATAAEGDKDFILNGSFEQVKSDGKTLRDWNVLDNKDKFVEAYDEEAYDGKYSAHLNGVGQDKVRIYFNKLRDMKPGGKYTLSFFANAKNKSGVLVLDVTVAGKNYAQSYPLKTNRWTEITLNFTVPKTGTAGSMYIGAYNGLDVLIDKVTVMGPVRGENDNPEVDESTVKPPASTVEVIADTEKNSTPPKSVPKSVPDSNAIRSGRNLVQNADFENDTNNIGPWNWEPYFAGWDQNNQMVVYDKTFGHESERSIKLTNGNPAQRPWVRQQIEVSAETEYQASMWYYTNFTAEESDADPRGKSNTVIMVEYYTGEPGTETYLGVDDLFVLSGTGGKWVQTAVTFTTPPNTKYIRYYARRYGVGTVWVDDMALYSTTKPNPLGVNTDQIFYYSDQTAAAVAEAELDLLAFPELRDAKVDFALTLNGKVVAEQKGVQAKGGTATWYFDLSWLTQKQTEYRIEATINGKTDFERVYKYDRPTYLGKDGVFRKNGQTVMPTYAWYYIERQYGYGMIDAQINVAEVGIPRSESMTDEQKIAQITKTLDDLWARGMYGLILTYSNSRGGGHPDLRHDTELICAAIKDHPAVYAYVNNDEPFARTGNPHDELRETYIAIRNNDPNHPVMSMEQGAYGEAAKFVDIFGHDPYPGDTKDPLTYVAQRRSEADEATQGIRPVNSLLQVMNWRGYFPSGDDLRSMIYQTFLEGGGSYGFFRFINASDAGDDLDETHLWEPLTEFTHNEREDAFKAFVFDEYPIFSNVKNDAYWAVSYVKGNQVNMVVLNRKKEDQQLSIPLTSCGGTHNITAFTGKAAFGGKGEDISGNGVLNITLPAGAAVLYEIKPQNVNEIAGVPVMRFRDLDGYDWAFNSILKMDNAGVLDSLAYHYYRPEKNITRGDFAMFLVRALGLKADNATCTFTDVLPAVTYSKEVAIGQALGILLGSGDGTFRPEEPISRQDFMVICARGMRLLGENGLSGGNLSAFSDASLVADYAAQDIMAMVNAGIVKGNADGTINPLGNTTRAEAAVIMDRISTWKAQ